ncbi:hypothetical protein ACFL5X_04025 [Candidatus Omnitrophota bacterium]
MRKVISILIISVLMLNCAGCYALRRKFVRKRKKDTPPPLYLELKEYPHVPTQEMYHQYWLFVRGWLDELIQSINEKPNTKRQKKAIDEAVMNFEQIVYFYNEEGKDVIGPMHTEILAIREVVHDPYFTSSMNKTIIKKRIATVKRRFEMDFTYAKAQDWLGASPEAFADQEPLAEEGQE